MTRDEIKQALKDGQTDRDISDAVLLECGWKLTPFDNVAMSNNRWISPRHEYEIARTDAPHVAASVDDALKLVPDGYTMEVDWKPTRSTVALLDGKPWDAKFPAPRGDTSTLAAAICLAVLEIE